MNINVHQFNFTLICYKKWKVQEKKLDSFAQNILQHFIVFMSKIE
jgi:hypothetical protein